MNTEEKRKKIIKDKFDKLEVKFTKGGRIFAFLTDDTYGVYIDRIKTASTSINGDYFMFRYIGINDIESLQKYGEYVLELIKDKYGMEVYVDFIPMYELVDFEISRIDFIYNYFMNDYIRENNDIDYS